MIQLCSNVIKLPLDLLKRTRHIVQPASKIVLFFRSLITSYCRKAIGVYQFAKIPNCTVRKLSVHDPLLCEY